MFGAFLTLIFLRPFVSFISFPQENFVYALLLCGILGIWFIRRGIPLKEAAPFAPALAALLIALGLSLLTSRDRKASLQELLINHYITGMLCFILTLGLSPRQKARLVWALLAGAGIASILAIHQYFFGFNRLLDYLMAQGIADQETLGFIAQKRVYFPFITPNTLASYLVLLIPLAATTRGRRWLIIPLSLALLLTKSVTALLSLPLALLLYLGVRRKLSKKTLLLLGCLVFIVAAVWAVRMQTTKKHLRPAFSGLVRYHYWINTTELIRRYPLTGVGPGNFDLPRWSHYAHNLPLQLWAELGFPSLVAFIWLIGLVFRRTLQLRAPPPAQDTSAPFFLALAAFLIHNLVDFTFFLPEVGGLWWIIAGVASAPDPPPAVRG